MSSVAATFHYARTSAERCRFERAGFKARSVLSANSAALVSSKGRRLRGVSAAQFQSGFSAVSSLPNSPMFDVPEDPLMRPSRLMSRAHQRPKRSAGGRRLTRRLQAKPSVIYKPCSQRSVPLRLLSMAGHVARRPWSQMSACQGRRDTLHRRRIGVLELKSREFGTQWPVTWGWCARNPLNDPWHDRYMGDLGGVVFTNVDIADAGTPECDGGRRQRWGQPRDRVEQRRAICSRPGNLEKTLITEPSAAHRMSLNRAGVRPRRDR